MINIINCMCAKYNMLWDLEATVADNNYMQRSSISIIIILLLRR